MHWQFVNLIHCFLWVLTDGPIEAVYVTNNLVGPDLRSFKVCVYVAFTLLQKRLM